MLYLVVGARPNFVKLAPLQRALKSHGKLPYKIIHTGQHYDKALSGSFFDILEIPEPDINLEVGSGRHGEQTAKILEKFEQLLIDEPPTCVVVFGDVTSTIACGLAAVKLLIPVVHVEAGLRSFDRTMPEEINRIVTDTISAHLFVSDPAGLINLANEGVSEDKIHHVGNVMVDSLARMLPKAMEQLLPEELELEPQSYGLLTMHRPSNVDDRETLKVLLETMSRLSKQLKILFPIHPRTKSRIKEFQLQDTITDNLTIVDPVDYLGSLKLQNNAKIVFTDSGGMQEETSYLNVPCATLRENTERPVTETEGTSTLVGNDPERIEAVFEKVMNGTYRKAISIPKWDGKTGERIATILEELYGNSAVS